MGFPGKAARTLVAEGRVCDVGSATLTRVVHVGDAPADVLAAKHCADAKQFGDSITVGCVGVATFKFLLVNR